MQRKINNAIRSMASLLFTLLFVANEEGCTKLVAISPPTNTITTTEAFSDSLNAAAAIEGIYTKMLGGTTINIGNAAPTIYCGLSADELIPFNSYGDVTQLYANTLTSQNSFVYSNFWIPAYQLIYQANAVIDGAKASTGLSVQNKVQFICEAEFLRAYFYFYLVNLFDAVPYVTSPNYQVNAILARTPATQIYDSIIFDLKDAQRLLPADYSAGGGDRIRANKWAATALLSRVYLYTKDYTDAESQADSIIANTTMFTLNPDLNNVFLNYASGNMEGILELIPNPAYYPYNATSIGLHLIPNGSHQPTYYISPQLYQSFESGDSRMTAWLHSTTYRGRVYYYPYKYKIGQTQLQLNATPSEYVMLLRLGEQFLIRAEAEAELNDLPDAINDLDAIRVRAGLDSLPPTLNQAQVLAAVMHERRIELFAEWGNRWFDLKRTGQIDSVMTAATPLKRQGSTWQTYQQWYPIPHAEMLADPKLTQNPEYQ